ncbi:MAG TPA: SGNH/GDSL hydrolase family protein [Pseudonocardiaceae bacterium]|nr:SGNH/GDSL hydrolase family protein [Pseudonocardiaceae bacterium]
MIWNRTVRVAAVLAGTIGGVTSAVYGVLDQQSKHAQLVIGEPEGPPPQADGRYFPPGTRPAFSPTATSADGDALRFAVIGDSLAAGIGAETADEVPGVRLARGLAEQLDAPVDLVTYAISGSTTPDIIAQVEQALAQPPDVVLVVVGGNDVTTRLSIRASAKLLGAEVGKLRAAGAGVVVGTCPDLRPIRPIQRPLRWIASAWSRMLAKAQDRAVRGVGGIPVALGDLVSPEFLVRPEELFSPDNFHPNGAGYSLATAALLAPLCAAAGADARVEPGLVGEPGSTVVIEAAVIEQAAVEQVEAEPAKKAGRRGAWQRFGRAEPATS